MPHDSEMLIRVKLMARQSQKLQVGAPDQRTSTRYELRILARGLATEECFDVYIKFISVDGLAIASAVELHVGTKFELTLPISGPTKARVVWSGGAICGCLFEAPLDTATLSAIRLNANPAVTSAGRSSLPLSTLIPLEVPERWPLRIRVAILVLTPLTIWVLIALLVKLLS